MKTAIPKQNPEKTPEDSPLQKRFQALRHQAISKTNQTALTKIEAHLFIAVSRFSGLYS
jgi:hypothetical protein